MKSPVIAIFVRHSPDCKYRDDETWKRCNCRKHLRWTYSGTQYRQSAGTRSWNEAEDAKRRFEDSYRSGGRTPVQLTGPKTIKACIDGFVASKQSQKVTAPLVKRYRRELDRLEMFLVGRGIAFPNQIGLDDLHAFRNTWDGMYPSTITQQKAQERLCGFLRYLHEAGHVDRVPRLSPIQVDEPPTLPLTAKEYQAVLDAVPQMVKDPKQGRRLRALVRLMRHSGLAIRDAATLERGLIIHDERKGLYRIVTARQKTGTDVSVAIPKDVAVELLAVLNGNPRYVFWSGKGKGETTAKYWQRQFRKLRVKSGLPNLHSHQLRDTFAVGLLEKGVSIQDVGKLLGHTSIKTTEKHYAPWVRGRQDWLDNQVTSTWN